MQSILWNHSSVLVSDCRDIKQSSFQEEDLNPGRDLVAGSGAESQFQTKAWLMEKVKFICWHANSWVWKLEWIGKTAEVSQMTNALIARESKLDRFCMSFICALGRKIWFPCDSNYRRFFSLVDNYRTNVFCVYRKAPNMVILNSNVSSPQVYEDRLMSEYSFMQEMGMNWDSIFMGMLHGRGTRWFKEEFQGILGEEMGYMREPVNQPDPSTINEKLERNGYKRKSIQHALQTEGTTLADRKIEAPVKLMCFYR